MTSHVQRHDGDEHGGALLCGVAESDRGVRLLARRFVPAIDGIDYVAGTRGYRALTVDFINRTIDAADDLRLVCLFVHGHGEGDAVEFSGIDMESHERGYRALLDIHRQMIGALVLSCGAVAGDIWLPAGGRAAVASTTVIGTNITVLTPEPVIPPFPSPEDDRQVRLLGDRGQARLRSMRVGLVGVGGAGMLAAEDLVRLGVGELVAIDPDRVALTNLNRLTGATRWDAMWFLTAEARPAWLRAIGQRLSTRKTRIVKRLSRRAGRRTRVIAIPADVRDPAAVAALKDCDYIVLAADSAIARHLVNYIAHQYLIPCVQVGVKIPVTEKGEVGDLFCVFRLVVPDSGCLDCAGAINRQRLGIEVLPDAERRAADYGTGEPAPSVITLNGVAVNFALSQMLLSASGLMESDKVRHVYQHLREGTQEAVALSRDPDCYVCGVDGVVGLGDLRGLPVPTTRVARTSLDHLDWIKSFVTTKWSTASHAVSRVARIGQIS
jgi:hypothetical protein